MLSFGRLKYQCKGKFMTQRQLLEMLDFFDSKYIWAFRLNAIRMYFNNEDEKSIQIALNRHTKNGIITQCARGVYANPRGKKTAFCTRVSCAYVERAIYILFKPRICVKRRGFNFSNS